MTMIYPMYLSELQREFRLWWSYRLSAVSAMFAYIVAFIVLTATFGALATKHGVNYGSYEQLAMLVGVLVWKLCMPTMAAIPSGVEEEARVGTLENVVISPMSIFRILVFRTAAVATRHAIETVIIGVFLAGLFRLPLGLSITTLIVLLLTLIGACGFGFGFAGLTMIYKSANNVAALISNLAIFISGALVPLTSLGTAFTTLKIIFPTTWGIDIARKIIIEGESLDAIASEVIGLAAQSLIIVVIGWIIFNWGVRRAKLDGSLGTY